jgi:hypothetical protein
MKRRPLSPTERAAAFALFADSIDYDAVAISCNSLWATFSATATGNTVNLRADHFIPGTLELSEAGRRVLIHELGHVWQYQNGGIGYVRSSLIAQLHAWLMTGSRKVAYDWHRAARNGRPWSCWNAEQQAECLSNYHEARLRVAAERELPEDAGTISLASTCIEEVRLRNGAPGHKRRRAAVRRDRIPRPEPGRNSP